MKRAVTPPVSGLGVIGDGFPRVSNSSTNASGGRERKRAWEPPLILEARVKFDVARTAQSRRAEAARKQRPHDESRCCVKDGRRQTERHHSKASGCAPVEAASPTHGRHHGPALTAAVAWYAQLWDVDAQRICSMAVKNRRYMYDPSEVERLKREIDLGKFAGTLGYSVENQRRGAGETVMRRGEEVVVIRSEPENGRWLYTSRNSGGDRGTIFDFVMQRRSVSFGPALGEVLAYARLVFQKDGVTPISSKTKMTHVGQPCRKCGTPVVRREGKATDKRKNGSYYYEWWLRCLQCGTNYFLPENRRFYNTAPAAGASRQLEGRAATAMIDPRCEPVCMHQNYVAGNRPIDRPDKLPWEE